MAIPAIPDVLIGAIEMTPTGGQASDAYYQLNTDSAHLDTAVYLFTGGSYRIDISARGVTGKAYIDILLNNVVRGTIMVSGADTALYSVYVPAISIGTYSLSLQLSNFSYGANTAKVGLIYFTPTTSTSPEIQEEQPPSVVHPGIILTSGHFASGHLRGFSAGPLVLAGDTDSIDLDAMRDSGANMIRLGIIIDHSPGSRYYYYCDKSGNASSEVIAALDLAIIQAEAQGFYVIIALYVRTEDYWGVPLLQDAIRETWQDLAAYYNGRTGIAAYHLLSSPAVTNNYAEYLRWQMDIMETIRTIDTDHTIIAEPVNSEMQAMMQQFPYNNIVYGVQGYESKSITWQGETPAYTVRNKYPATISTANLSVPWDKDTLAAQYNNVRIFSDRFHTPMLVTEFSCVNWAPANEQGQWSSTQYVSDSIDIYESLKWAWCYHSWRGTIEWDSELSSSYWLLYSFDNARPIGGISSQNQAANRSSSAPTIFLLCQWFTRNREDVLSVPAEDTKGYYGMTAPNPVANNSLRDILKGFFIRDIRWEEIQPGPDLWDWAAMDNMISSCVSSGLPVIFMIRVGPDSPPWIYDTVPKIITTGGGPGLPTEYPWYPDLDYIRFYKAMYEAVNEHILHYPAIWRNALTGWQSAEGYMGEMVPWYGEVVTHDPDNDQPYELTKEEWTNFIRDNRLFLYATNIVCPCVFNAGRNGEEWEWIQANCPGSGIKNSQPGNSVGYDGELITITRPDKPDFYKTESEQVQQMPWWNTQVFQAIAASSLQAGITRFCMNNAAVDRNIMDFFNRHVNTKSRGFTLMHKGIDYTDTSLYPESTYGDLIKSADMPAYELAIQQAESLYDGIYLDYIRMTITRDYINSERVAAIQVHMSSFGALSDPDNPYRNNYGYMLFPGNYEKGLKIVNHSFMNFQWRLGATNQPYGLSALTFGTGLTEFYLDLDSDFELQLTHALRVTYHDSQGCWSLSYANGTDITTLPVTATGIDQWVTKEYIMSGINPTGVSGHAFRINKCSNESVPFGMIEIV
jgi:hypothetical protein